MSFYKDALPVDEIRQILSLRLTSLPSESIPLSLSLGRVAAAAILANCDDPGFDRSAMDGYALHSADLEGGTLLPLAECVIGRPPASVLEPGKTAYVSTGSPVPIGSAAVVPIELARIDGECILVAHIPNGKNIVRQGERIHMGFPVVAVGDSIDLKQICLLAAQGIEAVEVVRRPTVTFFSTGDEVAKNPGPYEVVDSITPAVTAWCHFHDLELKACTHLPDDIDRIGQALEGASSDLVITSGGASVGRRDFTRKAVAGFAEIIVAGICAKPGSPAFVAIRGKQTYLGLPGNPSAAAHQLTLLGKMIVDRIGAISPTDPDSVEF